MTNAEHIELLKVLEHKGLVIISGYDNDIYNEYLKGWSKVPISTNAERGFNRTETLWMNFETQLSFFENYTNGLKAVLQASHFLALQMQLLLKEK